MQFPFEQPGEAGDQRRPVNGHFAVEHHIADLGDIALHYVLSGPQGASTAPVVLLHGWPETWYEWRHVIPALARERQVVAPDLRGLGDSSRPLDGYDKRTVAEDVWRLVGGLLGFTRFHLVGHDWGGPVAFALASAHPDAVATLAILDVVIPGDGGDFSQGGRRWHHAFHMTPDLPEGLVAGRERLYLSWFYRHFSWRPDAIPEAAITGIPSHLRPARRTPGGVCLLSHPAARRRRQPRPARNRVPARYAGAGNGRREDRGARPRDRAGGVAAAGRDRCPTAWWCPIAATSFPRRTPGR